MASVIRALVIVVGVLGLATLFIGPFRFKRWPHKIASVFVGLLLLGGSTHLAHGAYHVWADQRRIADVSQIARIVDEFHSRTGRYPLASLNIPVTVGVNITLDELPPRYTQPPPGAPGEIVPYSVLLAELRSVLGDDLELPMDPQRVAVYAPNFYQYQYYDDGSYYVSVNLYYEIPGTERLADHYYKYELSSADQRR